MGGTKTSFYKRSIMECYDKIRKLKMTSLFNKGQESVHSGFGGKGESANKGTVRLWSVMITRLKRRVSLWRDSSIVECND